MHTTYADCPSISAAALFDHHDVVDTMSHSEACTVGTELDHSHVVVSYLCSKDKEVQGTGP